VVRYTLTCSPAHLLTYPTHPLTYSPPRTAIPLVDGDARQGPKRIARVG
jgi:hypothetical protein